MFKLIKRDYICKYSDIQTIGSNSCNGEILWNTMFWLIIDMIVLVSFL